MMPHCMLEVADLYFEYPDKQILQGVQFSVNRGTLLHLRGENGAGKTTLLKLISGMLQPEQGDIYYDGCSIWDDIAHYQQTLCYVGHKSGISQLLTVRENCRFELPGNQSAIPFAEIMALCGLEGLEDVLCGLLSVGQRRRVGLMRLFMSGALLWLLDEPLVALDNKAIDILIKALDMHLARGGLVVLTSHQMIPLKHDSYQEYHL